MGYRLDWVPSPNFTPGSQTQAVYRRPRTVSMGAGHWWNYPRAGATHDGVVNMFKNPARQGSCHAVLSAGRVTEMVRPWDTAWCTSAANPYTYAIETDPRIMFHWGQYSPSAGEKALGDQIFETLAEYIADKGYHNLEWKAHNKYPVPYTECNPIPWGDVMTRAKQIWNQKHAPAPQVPEWQKNKTAFSARRLRVKAGASGQLINLANVNEAIKTLAPGTEIDFKGYTDVGGHRYYISAYAWDHNLANGMREWELEPIPPPTPEWLRNLRDITPVKLMVMVAQTPIVNLNDLSTIKMLGQGTWVDFTKMTTVQGREFLISSYSATNGMPNGIAKGDVGVPAEPGNEKPEWLANWQDIADVTMYTRVDAELVDLTNGKTVKTIPRGTAVEIASATEYLHKKYMITKYSTEKKLGQGILVDDLDMKNPNDRPEPEPAPTPPIEPKAEWETHDVALADPRQLKALVEVNVTDFSTGKTVGDPIPAGKLVDMANQTMYQGKVYLRSKWAVDNKKPYGMPAVAFGEAETKDEEQDRRLGIIEAFIKWLKEQLAKIGIK